MENCVNEKLREMWRKTLRKGPLTVTTVTDENGQTNITGITDAQNNGTGGDNNGYAAEPVRVGIASP